MVCRILVPQPGIKPMAPMHWKHSLSHGTPRAVPNYPCSLFIWMEHSIGQALSEWMNFDRFTCFFSNSLLKKFF